WEHQQVQTEMYFGISYTYNPYRAITGISGMITPYTETTHTIRYTGVTTPAGTLLSSNVSIMGNPTIQAGISYGYFNMFNMRTGLYPNWEAHQQSDIPWLSGGQTEILSRYLLQAGPVSGVLPLTRGEVMIVTNQQSGTLGDYVPVCDIRTPGDYTHPMNFALDTVNIGSEYLYIYLRKDAGGRVGETNTDTAVYKKKHYVAAVFCGSGKTPEEALNVLYANAAGAWPGLASLFPDISDKPLVTEFDEVIPIDLSSQNPWYEMYVREVGYRDPSDNEWVYGNDAANYRWGHRSEMEMHWDGNTYLTTDTADETEVLSDCAYIGVVRTGYEKQKIIKPVTTNGVTKDQEISVCPTYGVLKYYTDNEQPPTTLNVQNVAMTLGGGPVKSKEGMYFVYYSSNTSTAAFSAPITEVELSEEAFINGFNTSVSVMESQRENLKLPAYNDLRMRTDEYLYIHTKFDMKDLPYIEHLYVGVGKDKKEAFADLIGTTNANAATLVNCNYNSYSKEWIAIGYRRTDMSTSCIKDVFLYYGDNPPDTVTVPGYSFATTTKRGKVTTTYSNYNMTYTLLKHNLVSGGSESISLNKGNGGKGLYLYYSKASKRCCFQKELKTEIRPIRNIVFGYEDASPNSASAEDMGKVFAPTLTGMKIFDTEAYRDMSWESVLGITSAPESFCFDGSNGVPMSINYGILPQMGNDGRHTADHRVMMYVDRGPTVMSDGTKYSLRANSSVESCVKYTASASYGYLGLSN
ncbi:MAG: hypothetical protein K5927_02335, partial [Lachnospiraceae bacterium]|nr:hypothetical protein [Lachnospiraceae bacterium]